MKAERTAYVGNISKPFTFDKYDDSKPNVYVAELWVHWDSDKVRGFKWVDSNQKEYTYADVNFSSHKVSTYKFRPGETLKSAALWQSSYGYGSWRGFEFTTSAGVEFSAGNLGDAAKSPLYVDGATLLSFFGGTNPDKFMQGIGLWVGRPS